MSEPKFSTLAVHGGEKPDPITGAIAPVLVRTKTFKQPQFGKPGVWQYARGQNPTREILENKLSSLESGGEAAVFGSGIAAEAMIFLTLNPGDEVILCKEVYGGTFRLFKEIFSKFNITAKFADFNNKSEIKKSITVKTKYLFVELLTNPGLNTNDLKIVNEISKETGVPYIADMTFTPPCSAKAFEYGAETIIHSLSKYHSGHNDVIGGVVITKNKDLYKRLKFFQRAFGAILSPDECYRVIQGIKTLEIRWKKSSENALEVAEYLSKHENIRKVNYPGLVSNIQHDLAKNLIKNGFGGVLSFETKNVTIEKLENFVKKLQEDDLIFYGESLGAPETILAYPTIMSHGSLPIKEQLELGINKWFFRLSLGLEDSKDIISSFEKALEELND